MTDYAELRAALEAGPTPGPWKWADDSRIATVTTVAEYRIGPDYKTSGQARYDFHAACEIDAAYIAAANPEAIRALLADADRATALEAANARLRGALRGAVALAIKAHGHWDSDQDMKVGKILLAMAGALPGYDQQADAIHAALAQEHGEKHDNQD